MALFKSRLSQYSRRGKILLAVAAVVAVALCFVAEFTGITDRLLSWTGVNDRKRLPLNGEIQVHVLDVGNADAIAVFCDGRAMLIDAGDYNDGERVTAFLKDYGVTHLDYVVATHADADHIGGMREVLSHVTVGEYVMTAVSAESLEMSQTYLDLMGCIREQKITVSYAKEGMTRSLGSAVITVLSALSEADDSNDCSLVCRVDYGQNGFLFMGDAGGVVEDRLSIKNVDADFLKIAHHGADTATGSSFLMKVDPSIAVVSCGVDNLYDHPHETVLHRLSKFDIDVYRTDRQGTVTVVGNGKTLSVITERE